MAALVVAGQLEEVEVVGDRDREREVADKRDAGLECTDQERLASVVVGGKLASDLADAPTDLVRCEEDVADPFVQ